MRRLAGISLLLALAACKDEPAPPPKEEFAIASCAYTPTGKVGERKWEECRLVGKNSCGQKIQHVVATDEFFIACQRAVWVDKKK